MLPIDPLSNLKKIVDSRPLQVSRWLAVGVLLDVSEMRALLCAFSELSFYPASEIVSAGGAQIATDRWLEVYAEYIMALKQGQLPDAARLRHRFSDMMSVSSDLVGVVQAGERGWLVRAERPVIQLRPFSLTYSGLEGKFRPQVRGVNAVSWGVQFAYPQLYQNRDSGEIAAIDASDRFPNTAVFKRLRRWLRHQTVATPFQVAGQRLNVPARIGKGCFEWINLHPQLRQQGIEVRCKSKSLP